MQSWFYFYRCFQTLLFWWMVACILRLFNSIVYSFKLFSTQSPMNASLKYLETDGAHVFGFWCLIVRVLYLQKYFSCFQMPLHTIIEIQMGVSGVQEKRYKLMDWTQASNLCFNKNWIPMHFSEFIRKM